MAPSDLSEVCCGAERGMAGGFPHGLKTSQWSTKVERPEHGCEVRPRSKIQTIEGFDSQDRKPKVCPDVVRQLQGGYHRDWGRGRAGRRLCLSSQKRAQSSTQPLPTEQNNGPHLEPRNPTLASCSRGTGITLLDAPSIPIPETQHNVVISLKWR